MPRLRGIDQNYSRYNDNCQDDYYKTVSFCDVFLLVCVGQGGERGEAKRRGGEVGD